MVINVELFFYLTADHHFLKSLTLLNRFFLPESQNQFRPFLVISKDYSHGLWKHHFKALWIVPWIDLKLNRLRKGKERVF